MKFSGKVDVLGSGKWIGYSVFCHLWYSCYGFLEDDEKAFQKWEILPRFGVDKVLTRNKPLKQLQPRKMVGHENLSWEHEQHLKYAYSPLCDSICCGVPG